MPKPTRTPNTRPQSSTSKGRDGAAPSGAFPPPTASEAAFERLLAAFDDVTPATPSPAPSIGDPVSDGGALRGTVSDGGALRGTVSDDDALRGTVSDGGALRGTVSDDDAFLDGLFAKGYAYLERDRFASIGESTDFYTKVVGVSFEGRQDVIAGLIPGYALELVREPANPHDANAIAVRFGSLPLGFIRREIARRIAPVMDAGQGYVAEVASVTGGGERNVGVNIRVRRERRSSARFAPQARAKGSAVGGDAVRVALIGERPLREAQRAVLDRVAAGRSTLAILGTGRGKSLCFQLPAAERALARGAKTLVFYPLRALANDQFDAMTRRLGSFGIRVLRANGSIDAAERAELDDALADGSWDVILATPEFATYHRDAFLRDCNAPDLVVVDEAHHVFESKHRAAYGSLGDLIRALGQPQVLALTATANHEAFREIRRALAIESWVIDPTVRDNLHVVDARTVTDKFAYLTRELSGVSHDTNLFKPDIAGPGTTGAAVEGKAIVYCNSRAEATKLADRLRVRYGPTVAFYHAGVPSPERARVEDLFRGGGVRLIVATSAFGEGIDLPDVRDVVLYHLNFDFTGFNQMAGRAGRDGLPARIHLLYNESDRNLNEYILARKAPSLETLRELYRGMRGLASGDTLRLGADDIARTLELDAVDGTTVGAAIRIFAEGGLVDAGSDDEGRFVRFRSVSGKVDLSATARYAEGQAEREAFERFCNLALRADAPTLEQIINRPIYPDGVPLRQ